jgi:hypothetical protein
MSSALTKSLQRQAPRRLVTEAEIPGGFVDFCAWMGVTLSPGQAELSRVAYDGVEPMDRALAARLFGDDVPMGRRAVVAAVCGARAGKSYVLVALRLVHGMLVRDVSALPPGVCAAALIIAPRDDLRMEVFRYALGAVRGKPELAQMLGDVTAGTFRMRRPDGYEVEFKTGVATSGGTAARGQWWTDFALDECAFFRDSSFKVNDEELFRAGSARVLPGGQTIIASTPWAEGGLLHRMWKQRPDDTAVAHAPTLALNDSPTTRAIIERSRASDPDNAKREFDAVFMTTGTTVFFEGATLDAATVDSEFEVQPGDSLAAGGDFGFRADSSALVMVALRDGNVHVFDGAEERPVDGVPLKPSVTVASFAQVISGRCGYLIADGHYREAISELLEAHGLVYAPGPTQPAGTYVRARMLLREGKVRIHGVAFRERLLQQLREVHGKPTSGGGMSIVHPRWATGGHGDLAAAFVLALWQVTGDTVQPPVAETGTQAWLDAAKERRRTKLVEQQERPGWMARGGGVDRGAGAHWRR